MYPKNFVLMACRLLAVIVGLVALLTVLPGTSVDACMCMPTHPQTHYCEADYGESTAIFVFVFVTWYNLLSALYCASFSPGLFCFQIKN